MTKDYKLTITWRNGRKQIDWHTRDTMAVVLHELADLVTAGAILPNEPIVIERIVPTTEFSSLNDD